VRASIFIVFLFIGCKLSCFVGGNAAVVHGALQHLLVPTVNIELNGHEMRLYSAKADQEKKDAYAMDVLMARLKKSYEEGNPLIELGGLFSCKVNQQTQKKECQLTGGNMKALNNSSAMAGSVYIFEKTQLSELDASQPQSVPLFFAKTLKTLDAALKEDRDMRIVVNFLHKQQYAPVGHKQLIVFSVPEAFIMVTHFNTLLNDIQLLHKGRGKELLKHIEEDSVDLYQFGESLWAFHEVVRPLSKAPPTKFEERFYLSAFDEHVTSVSVFTHLVKQQPQGTSAMAMMKHRITNVLPFLSTIIDLKTLESLHKQVKEAWARNPDLKNYFYTRNHGDCHARNVFYDKSKFNNFSFIDFSSMARDVLHDYSLFTNDVAYFIFMYAIYWHKSEQKSLWIMPRFLAGYLKNVPQAIKKDMLLLVQLHLEMFIIAQALEKKGEEKETYKKNKKIINAIISTTNTLLGFEKFDQKTAAGEDKVVRKAADILKSSIKKQ